MAAAVCGAGGRSIGIDHEAQNRRQKRALARVTEERDILKRVSHGAPLVQARCPRAVAESFFQLLKRKRLHRNT